MRETLTEKRVETRPDPEWVRGRCPTCSEVLISNARWIAANHRYVIEWICWGALQEPPTCDFHQML